MSQTFAPAAAPSTPSAAAARLKRSADDALDDEQRFTKRFNLLNIIESQPSKLYIPVDPSRPPSPPPAAQNADSMAVDDTPNRVYIQDLSAELASIEATEAEQEKIIFLPDIEKALAAAPAHLLHGRPHPASEGKELILYSSPAQVAEGDVVKAAIAEMKRRAAEKLADTQVETAHGYEYGEYNLQEFAQEMGDEEDEDYMDIE